MYQMKYFWLWSILYIYITYDIYDIYIIHIYIYIFIMYIYNLPRTINRDKNSKHSNFCSWGTCRTPFFWFIWQPQRTYKSTLIVHIKYQIRILVTYHHNCISMWYCSYKNSSWKHGLQQNLFAISLFANIFQIFKSFEYNLKFTNNLWNFFRMLFLLLLLILFLHKRNSKFILNH